MALSVVFIVVLPLVQDRKTERALAALAALAAPQALVIRANESPYPDASSYAASWRSPSTT